VCPRIAASYRLDGRSLQWLRGLIRSAAARLMRLWIRIPPGAWMSVYLECCVLSGRGLYDELITRPEEFYRLWCVVVCDLETSWMRRPYPTGCCDAKSKQTNRLDAKIDASHLRKNINGKRGAMQNILTWEREREHQQGEHGSTVIARSYIVSQTDVSHNRIVGMGRTSPENLFWPRKNTYLRICKKNWHKMLSPTNNVNCRRCTTYMHTYIHTYVIHTYIHTCIHTYMHACIHTYITHSRALKHTRMSEKFYATRC
jgi:hypothetical protein